MLKLRGANIMREACVKLCLLLEMLVTVKYTNILHYYCDIACAITNMCTKLYSCCSFSFNGALSTRRPRLSEIWERVKTHLLPSGITLSIFKMAPPRLNHRVHQLPFQYLWTKLDCDATYWIHGLSLAEQSSLALEAIMTPMAAEDRMLEDTLFILYSISRRATTCAC